MAKFNEIVDSKTGSKFVLQGNIAFALGVIHAGYHAVDGYPGTPSTEVIDKGLKHVQDRIKVGWSVNEAVAMGVAVGHSVAGMDAMVTMKIPGVFQAGDVVATSAFYTGNAGALVIYAATDYVPSSTQHVIDARYFFSSCRVPILMPRNHQEMYDIAFTAADLSRKFNTQVVVLASGILAHSEGLVTTKESRSITPRELPINLNDWMLLPTLARANYNKANQERIPNIQEWSENSSLIDETPGSDEWGIIVTGESDIIVREALTTCDLQPSILSLGLSYPLPLKRIKKFADKIKGKLFVFEDGDKFLQEKLLLNKIEVIGKEENSIITDWTPEKVLNFLGKHLNVNYQSLTKELDIKPQNRPPSICPGCPYRAFGLVVAKLKKQKKLYASFGDIGCSTLIYFMNSLDTVLCMGASDSMRQGFVISRPEMKGRTISVLGDSCECHSGLDATRNAVFRKAAGVKIVLDNRITAMTGGQPAPSSQTNLAGEDNSFNLEKVLSAENEKTTSLDSFNMKQIEKELIKALNMAEKGQFSTLILKGPCIQETEKVKKMREVEFDLEKCKKCRMCNMCPGISFDDEGFPHYTNLCANCGSNGQVCQQCCKFESIIQRKQQQKIPGSKSTLPVLETNKIVAMEEKALPESLRVAIRGIGGQGNLFFGKILSEVAINTSYSKHHIVKGDTHGMAQLGGSVISTFCCGKVYSPVLAPGSADVLVAMEISEILRPGFLELLKSGGTVIFNNFKALPIGAKEEEYPKLEDIEDALSEYNVIKINANQQAYELGDTTGRTANVVVIGLLSTIEPFNKIPREIWLNALMNVSPSDGIRSANQMAFNAGCLLQRL